MNLNWPNLVEQGRCKAFGIPWNEEELRAIYEHKIPPEYVRGGCLTPEAYEAARGPQGGAKKDKYKKLGELRREADSLGVRYGEETTRAELLELIVGKRETNQLADNPLPSPEAADRR